MNLTHTCVEELAPVIHSAVSGDLIQMQRFSAEQLEMLKMMAATNIPKPCLYRVMLNLNQGITWPYEWLTWQVKTLRRQLKKSAPNPFLQLHDLRRDGR